MTAETDRNQEVLMEFQLGCLLVPITMKIVMMDALNDLRSWGDHPSWVSFVMSHFGRVDLSEIEIISQIIKAGKNLIWGDSPNDLESTVAEMVSHWEDRDATAFTWWKSHLIGTAVRATVEALSPKGEEGENLEKVKVIEANPQILKEVLSQLGMEISEGRAEELAQIFARIGWE